MKFIAWHCVEKFDFLARLKELNPVLSRFEIIFQKSTQWQNFGYILSICFRETGHKNLGNFFLILDIREDIEVSADLISYDYFFRHTVCDSVNVSEKNPKFQKRHKIGQLVSRKVVTSWDANYVKFYFIFYINELSLISMQLFGKSQKN